METPEQEPLLAEIIEEERVADEPIVPTDDVVVPIEEDQAAAESGGD